MILDIGCGSGVLVNRLSKMGYRSYGVDWSEPAIHFAKQHMHGSFRVANVENLNPHDLGFQFDLITASHILEHLVEPHSFLRSVAGLLKPNGYLVIAVPNLNWYDPYSAWRSVSTIFHEEHVVGYTPPGLQMVLNQSGFDVVGMTTKTHQMAILTAIGVSVYKKLRKGKDGGSDSHQGAIQQAYGGIASNPVVLAVLSRMLALFNRMSEKNLRGMELIAVARLSE
jgi:SAM-dependent methyltransferase